ncbi:MAG TPA: hypothetical protein EYP71_05345 [Dehalococcoidia bacterium]|nr:hypothetical protein [Dehalococcoidia bacterium]
MEAVNKNESFHDAARHWESDFLCICNGDEELHRELSQREFLKGLLSLLKMMSPESGSKYKGTPTGSVFQVLGISLDAPPAKVDSDELMSKASKLSLDEVRLLSLYIWIEFGQGTMRRLTPVGPGEHENAALKIHGDYSTWKQMVVANRM